MQKENDFDEKLDNATFYNHESETEILKTPDKNKIYSKKIQKIIKYLKKKKSIERKIQTLLQDDGLLNHLNDQFFVSKAAKNAFENDDIYNSLYNMKNLIKQENANLNIDIEYSFSPSLLVKKIGTINNSNLNIIKHNNISKVFELSKALEKVFDVENTNNRSEVKYDNDLVINFNEFIVRNEKRTLNSPSEYNREVSNHSKIFHISKFFKKFFDEDKVGVNIEEPVNNNLPIHHHEDILSIESSVSSKPRIFDISKEDKKKNNSKSILNSSIKFNSNLLPSERNNIIKKFETNYYLLQNNLLHLSQDNFKSDFEKSLIREKRFREKKLSKSPLQSDFDSFSFFSDSSFMFTSNFPLDLNSNNRSTIRDYSKMNFQKQINSPSTISSRLGKKYKMYTNEEKKFCVDLVNNYGLSTKVVSYCCEVPKKSLVRWIIVGHERKKGGGRKLRDPEMENKLLSWYNEVIQKGRKLTAAHIRDKARELTNCRSFLASKGWLEKFKKKYKLCLVNKNERKKTSFIKEI